MIEVAIDKFVEITPNDEEWNQVAENGIEVYPRATFEISKDCPYEIAEQIMYAYNEGLFTLKAYVPESHVFQELMIKHRNKGVDR